MGRAGLRRRPQHVWQPQVPWAGLRRDRVRESQPALHRTEETNSPPFCLPACRLFSAALKRRPTLPLPAYVSSFQCGDRHGQYTIVYYSAIVQVGARPELSSTHTSRSAANAHPRTPLTRTDSLTRGGAHCLGLPVAEPSWQPERAGPRQPPALPVALRHGSDGEGSVWLAAGSPLVYWKIAYIATWRARLCPSSCPLP